MKMTKKMTKIAKEYEVTKRNIKTLTLMEMIQFYFETVTENDLELYDVLPVRILCNIEELEEHLANLSELA